MGSLPGRSRSWIPAAVGSCLTLALFVQRKNSLSRHSVSDLPVSGPEGFCQFYPASALVVAACRLEVQVVGQFARAVILLSLPCAPFSAYVRVLVSGRRVSHAHVQHRLFCCGLSPSHQALTSCFCASCLHPSCPCCLPSRCLPTCFP